MDSHVKVYWYAAYSLNTCQSAVQNFSYVKQHRKMTHTSNVFTKYWNFVMRVVNRLHSQALSRKSIKTDF